MNATDTIKSELSGLDVDVYSGPINEASDAGVFCLMTGGPAPESFFGKDPEQHKFKTVQIRIRHERDQFKKARDLAETVWTTLSNAQPSGWIIFRMVNSDPIYLGRDVEDRHEFSINITGEIIE